MNPNKTLSLTIMGRDFCITCPKDEEEDIQLAAAYLDQKVREVKTEGKIVDSDRIALIAALGIAHELLMLRNETGFDIDEFKRTIKSIDKQVDEAINSREE